MKYMGLALALITLSGCVSTSIQDYTDPEYKAFTAKKMLVNTPYADLDEYLVSEAKDRNLDVVLVPMQELFPPTRQFTDEQKLKATRAGGFDSYLAIKLVGDTGMQSQVTGYQTTGTATANTYGNATAYGYGNSANITGQSTTNVAGQSTTTATRSYSRSTQSKAILFDPETQNIIWMADLATSGNSKISVGLDDAMEAVSEEVIESLIKAGHLKIKQPAKK